GPTADVQAWYGRTPRVETASDGSEPSMCNPAHESTLAARAIVAAARRLLIDRATPILIALDGASGTGKSVLAALVAEVLGASVIPSDDFFAAEITDAEWEARSPIERATDAIDWRRLRRDALQPLRARGSCLSESLARPF